MIKDTVEALNNHKGVVVDSLFYYRAMFVLSCANKTIAFLKMAPKACVGWLIHLVGTPST